MTQAADRADRRDHADAQPAHKPVRDARAKFSQLIDRAQDVADAQGGLFSELGSAPLWALTLEQHAAQSFLQLLICIDNAGCVIAHASAGDRSGMNAQAH